MSPVSPYFCNVAARKVRITHVARICSPHFVYQRESAAPRVGGGVRGAAQGTPTTNPERAGFPLETSQEAQGAWV